MKKYFFFDGTTQHGPFTLEELRAHNITPKTSVWFDSIPQWKPAGEISELQALFNNTAAPVPENQPAGDLSTKDFYYMDNSGKQQGPFKLNQLAGRNITAQTQVWYESLASWTTAGQIPALQSIINSAQTTATAAATTAQPTQTGWENVGFYFIDGAGTQQGPFKLNQLPGKNITAQTQVWYESLASWTTAGKIPALQSIISAAQTTAASTTVQPTQTGWENVGFYFIDGAGTQQGPFKLSQLAGKNISAQTQVWYESLASWTTAGQIPALQSIISSAQTTAASTTVQPTQTGWENVGFYFIDGAGTQQGPFKLSQLAGKNISAQTQVWYESLSSWTTAGQIPVLKAVLENKTAAEPSNTTSISTSNEDWSKKQFFIAGSNGAQQGPFTLKQLEDKNITEATSVWYDPLSEWTTAGKVAALKGLIDAAKARMEEWKNKFYFISDASGTRQGPFKMDQLKDKNLTAETPIWYDPLTEWTTAGKIPALKEIIS